MRAPEPERFMRLALREAEKGLGRTSPNPAVGAVVVRAGRVVGRGHHARAGGPHGEVEALRAAGAKARGADLYTTLEPCDHWGKTPPCSLAILEAGVRRVFVGSRDPNPVVKGRGVSRLRRAGVEVVRCRARGGRVDLADLLRRLAARGVAHLLVEGGAEVHAAFLAARLVDRVLLHVAPKILGGGKDWLGGAGPPRMADALSLRGLTVRRLGDDLILSGEPAWPAAARAPRSAPASGLSRRQSR